MIPVFWIGTFVMLVLAVSLIVLAIFYQRNLHQYKLHESELLLKASLESEQVERARIASELHDGLQGDLNAVKNFLFLLSKNPNDIQRDLVLKDTRDAVEMAIETTRLLSHKLMPPLLEEQGYEVVIQKYLASLEMATGKKFVFRNTDINFKMPTAKSYEFYRIIQEFTTNALKYGTFHEFMLALYGDSSQLIVELIDDGIPFDFYECYKSSQGSGLRNIQSRLKYIQGELVQRPVQQGNHFEIRILKSIEND